MATWQPLVPPDQQKTYDRFHFAPAVRVGDLLLLSGVVGSGADHKVPADARAEFDQAFANLRATVEHCGASWADLCEITSYHVDLADHLGAFIAAKDAALPHPPSPAWTAIGVSALVAPGARVEIRATVAFPAR
jgi:enamine deaminase RidA (YjgF/YER057c/UK114 family)